MHSSERPIESAPAGCVAALGLRFGSPPARRFLAVGSLSAARRRLAVADAHRRAARRAATGRRSPRVSPALRPAARNAVWPTIRSTVTSRGLDLVVRRRSPRRSCPAAPAARRSAGTAAIFGFTSTVRSTSTASPGHSASSSFCDVTLAVTVPVVLSTWLSTNVEVAGDLYRLRARHGDLRLGAALQCVAQQRSGRSAAWRTRPRSA